MYYVITTLYTIYHWNIQSKYKQYKHNNITTYNYYTLINTNINTFRKTIFPHLNFYSIYLISIILDCLFKIQIQYIQFWLDSIILTEPHSNLLS